MTPPRRRTACSGGGTARRRRSVITDVPGCLLPASFLRVVGFGDVHPHHRYPRLRYELESGINWKAEVEAALESLFTESVLSAASARAPELVGAAEAPAGLCLLPHPHRQPRPASLSPGAEVAPKLCG